MNYFLRKTAREENWFQKSINNEQLAEKLIAISFQLILSDRHSVLDTESHPDEMLNHVQHEETKRSKLISS